MKKKFFACPKCGKPLKLDKSGDSYFCKTPLCSVYSISVKEVQLIPYKEIYLGKVKIIGKVYFRINTTDGMWGIYTYNNYYGNFELKDLTVDVKLENELIYETSKGVTPFIVGGMLFGAVGAVAGSMAANKKEKVVSKKEYLLTLTTNRTDFTGFQCVIKDYNVIHDFIVTIENTRKILFPDTVGDESTKEETNDTTINVYDKMVQLKDLFDKGIIDEKEYQEKREKYLKLL